MKPLILIVLSTACASHLFGAYTGYFDGASCTNIQGWAEDTNLPNSPINVDLYDGSSLVTTVTAGYYRQDLLNAGIGNGYHAFSFNTPSSLINGATHTLWIRPSGSSVNLGSSPRTITCAPASHNYTGYLDLAGCATINGWAYDLSNTSSFVTIGVYLDGSNNPVVTASANAYRYDLPAAGIGNGYHAFSIPSPAVMADGALHSVSVRPVGWNSEVLGSSPVSVSCSSHHYAGWLDRADCNVIQGWGH